MMLSKMAASKEGEKPEGEKPKMTKTKTVWKDLWKHLVDNGLATQLETEEQIRQNLELSFKDLPEEVFHKDQDEYLKKLFYLNKKLKEGKPYPGLLEVTDEDDMIKAWLTLNSIRDNTTWDTLTPFNTVYPAMKQMLGLTSFEDDKEYPVKDVIAEIMAHFHIPFYPSEEDGECDDIHMGEMFEGLYHNLGAFKMVTDSYIRQKLEEQSILNQVLMNSALQLANDKPSEKISKIQKDLENKLLAEVPERVIKMLKDRDTVYILNISNNIPQTAAQRLSRLPNQPILKAERADTYCARNNITVETIDNACEHNAPTRNEERME